MKKHFTLIILFRIIFLTFSSLPAVSQSPFVTVSGEVEKPLRLDAETILKMKRANITSISHSDHKQHLYSGILLSDIIKESGAIPGNQLKGKYLAKYILIKAADNYQAVIALPETDTAFTDKIIILADKKDGKALPPDVGPFQIIVGGDKRPARCVRQVTAINILSAKQD